MANFHRPDGTAGLNHRYTVQLHILDGGLYSVQYISIS
jgi:hypothetical protein